MLSIPKNLFYVIQRCGNLHKLAIWKLIFTAREVNGIQRSETLPALKLELDGEDDDYEKYG